MSILQICSLIANEGEQIYQRREKRYFKSIELGEQHIRANINSTRLKEWSSLLTLVRGGSVEFSLGSTSGHRLITHTNTLGTHNILAPCRTDTFGSEINLVHRYLSPKLELFY